VFEHAFLLDYGLERGECVNAFMKNVDWEIASERYHGAKQIISVVAQGSETRGG
jgi:superoxide dismutase